MRTAAVANEIIVEFEEPEEHCWRLKYNAKMNFLKYSKSLNTSGGIPSGLWVSFRGLPGCDSNNLFFNQIFWSKWTIRVLLFPKSGWRWRVEAWWSEENGGKRKSGSRLWHGIRSGGSVRLSSSSGVRTEEEEAGKGKKGQEDLGRREEVYDDHVEAEVRARAELGWRGEHEVGHLRWIQQESGQRNRHDWKSKYCSGKTAINYFNFNWKIEWISKYNYYKSYKK